MCFVSGHALFLFKIKLTLAVLLLHSQNFQLKKNVDVRVTTFPLALRVEVSQKWNIVSFVCEIFMFSLCDNS